MAANNSILDTDIGLLGATFVFEPKSKSLIETQLNNHNVRIRYPIQHSKLTIFVRVLASSLIVLIAEFSSGKLLAIGHDIV